MSRGLGRVQRAVLDALRRRGGYADLRTLLVDIYYPQNRDDPLDARTHMLRYRARHRRNPSWYKHVQRAVARLEQLGLVRTEMLTVSTLAITDHHERRWKAVQLVELGIPPVMVLPMSWYQWLGQEGYTLVEEYSSIPAAGYTLSQWNRDRAPSAYLLAVVAADPTQAPLLLPCATPEQRAQLMQWVRTTDDLYTADGGWDTTRIQQMLQMQSSLTPNK